MPRELIRPERSTAGEPLLDFAGRRYKKLGLTRVADLLGAVPNLTGNPSTISENLLETARCEARTSEILKYQVFDSSTVRAVERVLIALERSEPLLLEGPTATTKTVAVIMAATLLGLRCWRVNFSGMTQVDDFIGRFAPSVQGSTGQREMSFVWADGAALIALRDGGVLLLDEPNLAPPPILDRLLPLLDSQFGGRVAAEFVLQERGNEAIPISRRFRVISAMNSATDAGRRRQSSAFFSRHTSYHTSPPSEADVEMMLRHLTTTEQLVVSHRDEPYLIPGAELVAFPGVERVSGWQSALIPGLAKFFVSLAQRCSEGSIGRDRRDPYVFDRRRLFAFLQGLDHQITQGCAPGGAFKEEFERYFFDTVADQDRALVADLAKSHSLWSETPIRGGRPGRRRADQEQAA